MKIVELILDEDQDTIGIDAISIVESPAIESDFVALNQQEIKLAEVDKEKKILLGALLYLINQFIEMVNKVNITFSFLKIQL